MNLAEFRRRAIPILRRLAESGDAEAADLVAAAFPKPKQVTPVMGFATCPACGSPIRTYKNGIIREHYVGGKARQASANGSPPCPAYCITLAEAEERYGSARRVVLGPIDDEGEA